MNPMFSDKSTRRKFLTVLGFASAGAIGIAVAPDGVRLVREENTAASGTSTSAAAGTMQMDLSGTQPPIKPGETFIYEFKIREGNAGSHMYHAHHNSAEQVTKGLLGPFIVEPKDPTTRPAHDVEYTIVLNDGSIGGFTLNGKGFPAT